MVALSHLLLAAYPVTQTAQLLDTKATRAQLQHWLIWWLLWAFLVVVDTLTLGWLPFFDFVRVAVLVPNYDARATALTRRLLIALKQHLRSLEWVKRASTLIAKLPGVESTKVWVNTQVAKASQYSWLMRNPFISQ
jgi:hypothetical protein